MLLEAARKDFLLGYGCGCSELVRHSRHVVLESMQLGQNIQNAEKPAVTIGMVRRFGPDGPVYIVTGLRGENKACICVAKTGEELDYDISNILADPGE